MNFVRIRIRFGFGGSAPIPGPVFLDVFSYRGSNLDPGKLYPDPQPWFAVGKLNLGNTIGRSSKNPLKQPETNP